VGRVLDVSCELGADSFLLHKQSIDLRSASKALYLPPRMVRPMRTFARYTLNLVVIRNGIVENLPLCAKS
jgi:hypothetical protein